MKAYPVILILVLLAFFGGYKLAAPSPIFETGAWYSVMLPKGNPPLLDVQWDDYFCNFHAKVIKTGPGQWAWIEYNHVISQADGTVTIKKLRTWFNFATVYSVTPTQEPDYKTAFPKGYTIAAYNGGEGK